MTKLPLSINILPVFGGLTQYNSFFYFYSELVIDYSALFTLLSRCLPALCDFWGPSVTSYNSFYVIFTHIQFI